MASFRGVFGGGAPGVAPFRGVFGGGAPGVAPFRGVLGGRSPPSGKKLSVGILNL